jgi:hypothetical protein
LRGGGVNYAVGSVSAALTADSNSNDISNFSGDGQAGLAEPAGRIIVGTAFNHLRVSTFINGEMQVSGEDRWKAWIVQAGVSLPFHIGWKKKDNSASILKSSGEAPETIPDQPPANVPPPIFIH